MSIRGSKGISQDLSSCTARLSLQKGKWKKGLTIFLPCPWEGFSCEWLISLQKNIISYIKMKPLQCKLYLLPLVIPMWLFQRDCLHLLCSHHLGTGILWREAPLSLFFSSQKRSNSFSLSSQVRFPNLWSSSRPFFGFSCFLPVFLGLWGPALHTLLQM